MCTLNDWFVSCSFKNIESNGRLPIPQFHGSHCRLLLTYFFEYTFGSRRLGMQNHKLKQTSTQSVQTTFSVNI